MNFRNLKMPQLPWKEVMLGEGLLNVIASITALLAINSFSDSAYSFIQNLSLEEMKFFLTLIAKSILAFGLLNISIPLLFIAWGQLLPRKSKSLNNVEL